MRIAIVISYMSNSSSGEERQLLLAQHMLKSGFTCDVFRCSRNRDDLIAPTAERAGVQFCIVDNPDEPTIPAATSASLLRRLVEGRYDIIVLRGMQTAVNDQVIETFGNTVRYASIPGGVFKDGNLARYGFIFFEHRGQGEFYARELSHRPALHRLPKYVPLGVVAEARNVDKDTDISVVAKFVYRKNHRLIYPLFSTDLRVRLIGSGPLQADAEELAGGRANVEFLGSLDWKR